MKMPIMTKPNEPKLSLMLPMKSQTPPVRLSCSLSKPIASTPPTIRATTTETKVIVKIVVELANRLHKRPAIWVFRNGFFDLALRPPFPQVVLCGLLGLLFVAFGYLKAFRSWLYAIPSLACGCSYLTICRCLFLDSL